MSKPMDGGRRDVAGSHMEWRMLRPSSLKCGCRWFADGTDIACAEHVGRQIVLDEDAIKVYLSK